MVFTAEIEMSELTDKSRVLVCDDRIGGTHQASQVHRGAISALRGHFHFKEGWAQNHPWRIWDEHSRSPWIRAFGYKLSHCWITIIRPDADKNGGPTPGPMFGFHGHWASSGHLLQYRFDVGNTDRILENRRISKFAADSGRHILNGAFKHRCHLSEHLLHSSVLIPAVINLVGSVIDRIVPN